MGITDVDVGWTTTPHGVGATSLNDVPLPALRRIRWRLSWLHGLFAASGAVLVLAFFHPLAYHLAAMRATTEGAITLLAIIAALLFWAQFSYTRRLRDLTLLATLAMFALLELVSEALPAAIEVRSGSQFVASALVGQLLIAIAIAAAASIPSTRLVVGVRRPVLSALGLGLVLFAAAELGGVMLRTALTAPAPGPVPGIGHALGRPLAVVIVIAGAALLLDASARLRRRARLEGSGALKLLAGAAILLAASRLYWLALPWVSPDWITSGELLRLLAFALIVSGAARQELDVRGVMARSAMLAERTRVARDLHDGLAQDLAFIAVHGARIAGDQGPEHPLAVAARSALALSRDTISDLADMSHATLQEGLGGVADELRARFGTAISVDADAGAGLSSSEREHVLRIAREAITNAARHGQAKNVIVSLARTDNGLVLQVRDDGVGIRGGSAAAQPEGFGLRSMRARAASLDGTLSVKERGRGGTELEVRFS